MINYDDLRKKAEALKQLLDNKTLGAHNLNVLEGYHRSLPPDVTLRLLRIIEVAKASSMNIVTVGTSPAAEYARAVLNEITKIENE